VLRKPDDQTLLALKFWEIRDRGRDQSHRLIDFNARGVTRLYETLQKTKDPSCFAAPEKMLAEKTEVKNKGIWKRFCQWIATNDFGDVVHDFGVINNFVDENHKRKCKVKALLRTPNGQTVLTLEYSTSHHNTGFSSWIEFDDKGIENLGQVIEKLHKMG